MANFGITDKRDRESPEYKQWKFSVFSRDGWRCSKCQSKRSLQAHHIIRWADSPQLRYVVSNGITLCQACHELVTGVEERFIDEFQRMVAAKKLQRQMEKGNPSVKKKFRLQKYRPPNPKLRF